MPRGVHLGVWIAGVALLLLLCGLYAAKAVRHRAAVVRE